MMLRVHFKTSLIDSTLEIRMLNNKHFLIIIFISIIHFINSSYKKNTSFFIILNTFNHSLTKLLT